MLNTQIYRNLQFLNNINKCVIYNWPEADRSNDQFLSLGTLFYLLENHNPKIFHIGTDKKYTTRSIKNADTIIIVGECLGSLNMKATDAYLQILQDNPNKKVIFFPTSVYFNNSAYLIKVKNIIRSIKDVSICVREQESYLLVEKYFKNAKIQLVPDMTFYLYDHIHYIKSLLNESSTPIMQNDTYVYNFINTLLKNINPDYTKNIYLSYITLLTTLIQLINKTNFKTDKLSIHILATILDNKHTFLPSDYHCNESFYSTWTKYYDCVNFEKD